MIIENNKDLKELNSFGVSAICDTYITLESDEDLGLFLRSPKDHFILGEGSNVLFTQDFQGTIVTVALDDLIEVKHTDDHVWLKVGAGYNWHELVMHCIKKDFGGLENLSLIPGTVGASPIQNIGAYGVEIMDLIAEVNTYNLSDGRPEIFSAAACEFSYRDSIFKNRLKDQYLISHVTFTLTKRNHQTNISYEPLAKAIAQQQISNPTIREISDAVIKIRQSKLPDPASLGNAGSFFKNPIVSMEDALRIRHEYPSLKTYPIDDAHVKLPAAWLIDQCGWKGSRRGDAGVHERHALVLVNYGNASGSEIYQLSEDILQSVLRKFGIQLEREVNVL